MVRACCSMACIAARCALRALVESLLASQCRARPPWFVLCVAGASTSTRSTQQPGGTLADGGRWRVRRASSGLGKKARGKSSGSGFVPANWLVLAAPAGLGDETDCDNDSVGLGSEAGRPFVDRRGSMTPELGIRLGGVRR